MSQAIGLIAVSATTSPRQLRWTLQAQGFGSLDGKLTRAWVEGAEAFVSMARGADCLHRGYDSNYRDEQSLMANCCMSSVRLVSVMSLAFAANEALRAFYGNSISIFKGALQCLASKNLSKRIHP